MTDPLLVRVARCEREAFEECIDLYGGLVWSMARRFCPEHAEDAVQEAFISLWKSAIRFDPAVASEKGFVAMVARRRMVDIHRRSERHAAATRQVDAAEVHGRPATHAPDAGAATHAVGRLLASLKETQRSVLALHIFEGLSHAEIAERLDMPLGTVKSHARRGLLDLRQRVQGVPQ